MAARTLERKIFEKQMKKQRLAGLVVDDVSLKTFTNIGELFNYDDEPEEVVMKGVYFRTLIKSKIIKTSC